MFALVFLIKGYIIIAILLTFNSLALIWCKMKATKSKASDTAKNEATTS